MCFLFPIRLIMLASNPIRQSLAQSQANRSDRRFLLFDLDYRGHHAGYIQHLVRYWSEQDLPGHLDVLVSPTFMQRHADVVSLAAKSPRQTVRFVAITPDEEAALFDSSHLEYSFKGRIVRAFQEWKLLRQYTATLGTTHCFLMYLDTLLLRLAVGSPLPCHFSALYFRPILHYNTFADYTPAGRERIWQWRDRVCLSRLLQARQLHTLFCLDPFAVDYINRVYRTTKVAHLADPVQVYPHTDPTPDSLRAQLKIEPQRQVFLFFGAFSERKGAHQLLDAIRLLPVSACQQLCLLIAGPTDAQEKEFLETSIATISATLPIQIVHQHRFVPDPEIQSYFQIADVVLAPYQRHIGMSAILVRAAAAQKPVLASNFGLMGEVVRHYRLGLAIDSTRPDEIAQGIGALLESSQEVGDRALMQQFAAQNVATQFATRVFQCLQSV
jgi:glycosyltransferase involved in cell wall biosynthesis